MEFFEKTEEIYKILNPTYKKYCDIRDDYLHNKTKVNGDPYTPYEAEKIAMDKVKFEIFNALNPFPSTGSKSLDWVAGKYQKHIEGKIVKSSQTWEEYFNSEEYLSTHSFNRSNPASEGNIPSNIGRHNPSYLENAETKLKLLDEYGKEIKGEIGPESGQLDNLDNLAKQNYVNEQKSQIRKELWGKRQELSDKLQNTNDPHEMSEISNEINQIDGVLNPSEEALAKTPASAASPELPAPELNQERGLTNGQQSESLKSDPQPNQDSPALDGQAIDQLKGDPSVTNNFYDPVTEQGTPSVIERVLKKNGTPTGGAVPIENALPGASAQPFGREELFSTPNAKVIKNFLYSGVKGGVNYAMGYLLGRARELVLGKKLIRKISNIKSKIKDTLLGKKLSKINDEINKYANLAKTFARPLWNAGANMIKSIAGVAWQSIAQSMVGQAIGSALTAVWGALTSIPIIGTAIASVGAAVSWAVGIAIGFLFAW